MRRARSVLRRSTRRSVCWTKSIPAKSYPYQEICERITAYRPEMYPDLVLSGEEAVHDLRCFVEDLSDSADMPVDRRRRAGADRRRREPPLQRLDQDRRSLAQPRPGEPPVSGSATASASAFCSRRCDRFVGTACGRSRSRQPVQPADERRAGRNRSPCPAAGALRRLPGGHQPAAGPQAGPFAGDDPLHA